MPSPSRRITLVISALGPGGAERVMSAMASHWSEEGRSVTILTLAPPDARPFFRLADGVVIRNLDLRQESTNPISAVLNNARRVAVLHWAIRRTRPDVVISFIDTVNVLTLIAAMPLRVPVVVEEHADPQTVSLGWPWRLLRWALYRGAAAVVTVTSTSLRYFPAPIRARGRVIPNPVELPPEFRTIPDEEAEPVVVGMGRLGPEKGFDLLLRAFAEVADAFPEWRLEIWGEGPLRPDLTRLARALYIDDRVAFPGLTAQPMRQMRRNRIFVLSSRFESFGNVLCEAMAAGLPVVAFDCPSGAREIVSDGVDGRLVPCGDVDAMASALRDLMAQPEERERLGEAARAVLERFDRRRIMAQWDQLLDRAIASPT
jgi:GalNAc-alpha-(1->4)-GalNAc-alpha-(1->3)-diNAcBac-PP-undecaprenol alpha-1,4-N-acetyl-D-galactosaminyltransferase